MKLQIFFMELNFLISRVFLAIFLQAITVDGKPLALETILQPQFQS